MDWTRPEVGLPCTGFGAIWILFGSLWLAMSSSLAADEAAKTPKPPEEATAPKDPATAHEGAAPEPGAPKGATTPQVEIIGHYQTGIETSDAASEGSVTYKLIEDRPIMRPGEATSLSSWTTLRMVINSTRPTGDRSTDCARTWPGPASSGGRRAPLGWGCNCATTIST